VSSRLSEPRWSNELVDAKHRIQLARVLTRWARERRHPYRRPSANVPLAAAGVASVLLKPSTDLGNVC
jgi:hypothetical protein